MLVQVSARFELARVRVIGIRLYHGSLHAHLIERIFNLLLINFIIFWNSDHLGEVVAHEVNQGLMMGC